MSHLPPTENWFFVRGLVREAAHWNSFPEQFAKAFPYRKVFCLDLPGNGEHFLSTGPNNIPAMAESLRADFLAKKKESPATENYLFTISLGSMVCLDWMHKHPADIQGAVLLNTSLRGFSPFYRRLRPQNYCAILALFFSSNILHIEKEILRITSNKTEWHECIAHDWEKIHKQRPVSKKSALNQILAAMKFRPPQEQPKAKILALASKADQLVHFSCTAEIEKHWGVETQYHESAGHDLTLDDPAWAIQQIKKTFS